MNNIWQRQVTFFISHLTNFMQQLQIEWRDTIEYHSVYGVNRNKVSACLLGQTACPGTTDLRIVWDLELGLSPPCRLGQSVLGTKHLEHCYQRATILARGQWKQSGQAPDLGKILQNDIPWSHCQSKIAFLPRVPSEQPGSQFGTVIPRKVNGRQTRPTAPGTYRSLQPWHTLFEWFL